MIRRALVAVTILGGVLWLIWLGGGSGVVSVLFGWLLLGYLIRCALPQLRRDFRYVRELLPVSTRKGDHL